MSQMGKTEENGHRLRLGFLKIVQPKGVFT